MMLSAQFVFGQQAQADSIRRLLKQNLPDTTRAQNLVQIGIYSEAIDPAQANAAYDEALNYALDKKLNYYAGIALYNQSYALADLGKTDEKVKNLRNAIRYLINATHSKAGYMLASTYATLATHYKIVEAYDSAVWYYLKAIPLFESNGYPGRVTGESLNLAAVYKELKLTDKQREYVDKAMKFAHFANDNKSLLLAYLYKALYYTELNEFSLAKKYADSSTVYYSESLDFIRRQTYFLVKADTYQNVKAFDSAVFYFEKCYQLAKNANSGWNMIEPLLQIGYIKLQTKDYKNAEQYLKQGIQLAEKDSIKVFMKEAYGTLSDAYYESGRFKEAYEYLNKHHIIKDTLLSEERKKFALNLEKKYETEKKDAEIALQKAELSKKNTLNYLLIGGASAILLVTLLLYRNYQHKQKIQQQRIIELETEKQLAATEAVLKGEEQERTRLAKDLHDGLGGMLSGIKHSMHTMKGNVIMTPENQQAFERSIDMLDSSIKEMRRVAHNLMPESLVKFGLDTAVKDFCNDMNESGALAVSYQSMGLEQLQLDETANITIYRIVQELINNVMKHAAAQSVIVQLNHTDRLLSITVEDDGKGFDTNLLKGAKGIGWSNIQNRVEFMKGRWDVESQPGKGASVHIEFDV